MEKKTNKFPLTMSQSIHRSTILKIDYKMNNWKCQDLDTLFPSLVTWNMLGYPLEEKACFSKICSLLHKIWKILINCFQLWKLHLLYK